MIVLICISLMFWKGLNGNKVNLLPCCLCLEMMPHLYSQSLVPCIPGWNWEWPSPLEPPHIRPMDGITEGYHHAWLYVVTGNNHLFWVPGRYYPTCESQHPQYCLLALSPGTKSAHASFQNLLLPEQHQLSTLNSDCKAHSYIHSLQNLFPLPLISRGLNTTAGNLASYPNFSSGFSSWCSNPPRCLIISFKYFISHSNLSCTLV